MIANFIKRAGTIFILILMLTSLSSWQEKKLDCTCFAVYFDKVYYGMNFDYPDVEIKIVIGKTSQGKRFLMNFEQNSGFVSTVGMNDKGLFSSEQMLYPENYNPNPRGPNEVYVWDIFEYATANCDNVQQIIDYMDTRRLIQGSDICLHSFVADKSANAIVIEPGNTGNLITSINDDFLIMTNFPIADFTGRPYNEVTGAGADRYIAAFEYISQNRNSFGYDEGIETLRRTLQTSGGYPTQCSMLFDPENNEVYVAFKNDFAKIWKVSINDGTIVSHSGFNNIISMDLGPTGILASELINASSADDIPENEAGFMSSGPNPFKNKMTLKYRIAEYGHVSIALFDLTGKKVMDLINEEKSPDDYEILLSAGENLESGVYFCRLETGGQIKSKKIVFQK